MNNNPKPKSKQLNSKQISALRRALSILFGPEAMLWDDKKVLAQAATINPELAQYPKEKTDDRNNF